MTKVFIPAALREFYVSNVGNDSNSGESLMFPLLTLQVGLDAAGAVDPPPGVFNPSQVNAEDGGLFDTGTITIPSSVNFFGTHSQFRSLASPMVELGSFSICEMQKVLMSAGTILFNLDAKQSINVQVTLLISNLASSIGFNLAGGSQDIFLECNRLRQSGASSIGVNVTNTFTAGTDLVVNVEAVNFEANDTTFFKYDPMDATVRAVVSVSTINNEGFTGTTAFDVLNGVLVVEQDGIVNADTVCRVASGATLHLDSSLCVGDIIVDAGGTLIARIDTHVGTLTNNGTIEGFIGGQDFGARTFDSAITAPSFNGVALTTAGVATDFLDAEGNYTIPTAAGGDVVGMPPSVDNALMRWDGTTAQSAQNSLAILSDTGVLASLTGLGINEVTPQSLLHVTSGDTGLTADVNSSIILESTATNRFLTFLGLNTSNMGLVFGNATNNADGGIIYLSPTRELDFRTAGNVTRLTLGATGVLTLTGQLDAGTNKLVNVVDPTANQDAATKAYVDATGSGDVTGPVSSTDDALVRFDATTGKLIQNSTAILSDAGVLSLTTATAEVLSLVGSNVNGVHLSLDATATDGDEWQIASTGDANPVAGGALRILNVDTSESFVFRQSGDFELASSTGSLVFAGNTVLFSKAGGNLGVGIVALLLNNGTGNVALGGAALGLNVTGNENTAGGNSALSANTASSNTAMGFEAGNFITGGAVTNILSSTSLYLGAETKALASGDTNEIVIGFDATGIGSNTVVLGNSSIGTTALRGLTGVNTIDPKGQLHVVSSGVSIFAGANRGMVLTDSVGPRFAWEDSTAGVDEKNWIQRWEAGVFSHSTLNDAGSAFILANILTMSGSTGKVAIGGPPSTAQFTITNPAQADGDELLELNTARRWAFQQEGSGSAANLRLRNTLGGNKNFLIDTDGATLWRSGDGTTNFMQLNQNVGHLQLTVAAFQGGAEFSTIMSDTATLGIRRDYGYTGAAAAVAFMISSADIARATAANQWRFTVKDKASVASVVNPITVTVASGFIDVSGTTSIEITTASGSVSFVCDGTNTYTV